MRLLDRPVSVRLEKTDFIIVAHLHAVAAGRTSNRPLVSGMAGSRTGGNTRISQPLTPKAICQRCPALWNAERQAVECGVEIGEYHGVVWVPRRVFQRLLPERPTPERCVEAYHLQRTRFERIAERKLRRRQLTEDGNVEISGRDLREGQSSARVMNRPPPRLGERSTLRA
jgi:hypothetical protein